MTIRSRIRSHSFPSLGTNLAPSKPKKPDSFPEFPIRSHGSWERIDWAKIKKREIIFFFSSSILLLHDSFPEFPREPAFPTLALNVRMHRGTPGTNLSGEVEELFAYPCGLPAADLRDYAIYAGIDLRDVLFGVKPNKCRHIAFLKTAPSRNMDVPEILRLITDASPSHLHGHASYPAATVAQTVMLPPSGKTNNSASVQLLPCRRKISVLLTDSPFPSLLCRYQFSTSYNTIK